MSGEELEHLFQIAVEKIVDASQKGEVLSAGNSVPLNSLPKEGTAEENSEEESRIAKGENLAKLIKEMNVAQRVKLAMFGNQTARTLLLRDSNRLIPMFVLENPRITENEIMEIAKNSQLDESVLREVGKNLQWMKNYTVKISLVSNPKTPLDITLRWLKYIKDKDLGRLAKSKNIPQVVSTQARKLLEKRERPGGGG